MNFGHLKSLKFFIGGGGYFIVNFGHLKSEVFPLGGGGAFWSEIPESPFLENLDKNLLFEVNCTETCLCITDSLSHTTYVETKKQTSANFTRLYRVLVKSFRNNFLVQWTLSNLPK